MNSESSLLVRDIGEQGLLKKLQPFCIPGMVGDDAAVLETDPTRSLVVTTDVLVDGVHFSDRTTTPADVGWRAVAANLSDLAAMGASPLGITVGLSIPGNLTVSWVENLYQGMSYCLKQYQTGIVGGDICRSEVISIAITAFGQVLPTQIIKRSSAQPGDAIVVTGFHGASRAGLELLLHPEIGQQLSDREKSYLIQTHQRPQPRLDVLPIIWEIFNSDSAIRIAGMDSSDGLADAIAQICSSSGVGAKIDRNLIPIPPTLPKLTSPEKALNWALYGGEDFELVLCLPLEKAQPLVKRLGNYAAIIGTLTKNLEILLVDPTKVYPQEVLLLSKAFQHF
ncbi:MAG: thiamine-phosphate kinase [Crinalium sp.]